MKIEPRSFNGTRVGRCALVLMVAVLSVSAFAQQDDHTTHVVQQGQILRDIARQYLDDPDLWPEVLQASGLDSPASVRPGVELRIPQKQVALADSALRRSLEAIQQATEAGARVFAPERIGRAIAGREQAVARRRAGDWVQCREFAVAALADAETAHREALDQRDSTAQAVLNSRAGRVQARRPGSLQWQRALLGAALVERERLRTLSESHAEVLFVDESQLRLGPNSQAIIQKMRIDLLNHRQDASVSLVQGDVYALLGGPPQTSGVDVQVPGVTTSRGSSDFWVSHLEGTTKVANYDNVEMLVASAGGTVALFESQGTVIEEGAAPTAPRDLLDSPELLEPADGQLLTTAAVQLRWGAVENAQSYRLEVATDDTFRRMLLFDPDLEADGEQLQELAEGDYYWRVAATDNEGFPGTKSRVRQFRVRYDRAAPYLAVLEPAEQSVLRVSPVVLRGVAERGARLEVDGKDVTIDANGGFEYEAPLENGLNTFVVSLVDSSGNVSRRERSLVYMPDRPAVVDFSEAFADTGLLRTGPRSFLARNEGVVLAGTTIPDAAIEVLPSGHESGVRSTSDAEGAFQARLTLASSERNYLLRVTAPSGFVTEDRFEVELDQEPPALSVEPEPLPVTRDPQVRLAGQITGSTGLWHGGTAVPVDNERFEIALELEPGENRIELLARDQVGNETRWQRVVLLDQEPPELLGHKVSPSRTSGGGSVVIDVQARDLSGLKRLARYVLRVGDATRSGTLVLDPLTGSYLATVVLPENLSGSVRLYSIVLEDYAGNRQTFRF